MNPLPDTYPAPAQGWTCFHCGENFRKPGSARIHFGTTPRSTPGCVIKFGEEMGLLMALRKAEDERDEQARLRAGLEEALASIQAENALMLQRFSRPTTNQTQPVAAPNASQGMV